MIFCHGQISIEKMSRVEFKQTISKAFQIFRQLLEEDLDQLEKINETYEKEVLRELDVIPESSLGDVMKGISIAKAVLMSMNYKQLNEELSKLPFSCSVELNVFEFIMKIIEEQIKTPKTRHGISALIKKFKPLIDCFTIALSNPRKYIGKASHVNDTSLDSIFEGM